MDRDFFRPPSILLHTPVKAGGSRWDTASTASSLPSTPHRLQGTKYENVILILASVLNTLFFIMFFRVDVHTYAQHAREERRRIGIS